jgi:iron complex outermembrane recepter protein
MYSPIQGILFWELLTVQPEEIERIEVVKGPVASLYGANANLGLINVISKTPEQLKGLTVAATGGTRQAGSYTLLYGGSHNDLSYKVSAGYQQEDGFMARGKDALDVSRGNMELKYKINDDSEAALSAGVVKANFYTLTASNNIADEWYYGPTDGQLHYVQGNYNLGGLKTKFYWTREVETYATTKRRVVNKVTTLDEDTNYSFNLGNKHSLVAGAGARLYAVTSDIFQADNTKHDESTWNVYLQDEYSILKKLTMVGSARVDHYPLTGYNPSARLALVYPHNEKNLFRSSVGYSFRSPTLSDTYSDFYTPIVAGLNQTSWGNKQLRPETYLTFETGYQGKYLNRKLRPFVDIFWTRIRRLFDNVSTGGGALGLDTTMRNVGSAYSSGFELGTEYDLINELTLIGNYAYNNVDYRDTSSRNFSPRNKVNLGFKLKTLADKLSFRFLAHYVSGASSTINGGGETKGYVMADLWGGYQINNMIEVSVSAYNLFRDVHTETPEGDVIDRRILGSVRIKF